MPPPPLSPPLFIGHEIYRGSSYGSKHPLAIERVSAVTDLVRALGWLKPEQFVESPQATPTQLARFHAPDYIAAVIEAEQAQRIDADRGERYAIGRNGNPIFAEVFRRPATAVGASLRAAEIVAGGGTVYSPAGGTHHGRPDRASGFCYFNDPVFAILGLLDQNLRRIAYVDFDAHHGDGVEDAFAEDERVLTLSVHERGRWPHLPAGPQRQSATVRNVAVPPGFNDDEFTYVLERVVLPVVSGFAPQAIVIQCGADALADDPLSKLELSNTALWSGVASLMPVSPRLIVLGGGGYNPWSVARCWAGVWATLNGIALPERLPSAGEAVLRRLTWNRAAGRNPPDHWLTTLADLPRNGPIRDETRAAADEALAIG
jgi:acetoin utilization protein AcuC